MESGPALFAGAIFTIFGTLLLLWTAARVRMRVPVAAGVHPVAAAVLATIFGTAALGLGLRSLCLV
jgi:hypothetical protein